MKVIFFLTSNESNTKKLTSTPDLINDKSHQPRSYPNLLVNLGIVGLHGDPNILNKALKHLKRNTVINITMTIVLNLTGKRFPFIKFDPISQTIQQGAAPMPNLLPEAIPTSTWGLLLSTAFQAPLTSHHPVTLAIRALHHFTFLQPQSSPSPCRPALSSMVPLSEGYSPRVPPNYAKNYTLLKKLAYLHHHVKNCWHSKLKKNMVKAW